MLSLKNMFSTVEPFLKDTYFRNKDTYVLSTLLCPKYTFLNGGVFSNSWSSYTSADQVAFSSPKLL